MHSRIVKVTYSKRGQPTGFIINYCRALLVLNDLAVIWLKVWKWLSVCLSYGLRRIMSSRHTETHLQLQEHKSKYTQTTIIIISSAETDRKIHVVFHSRDHLRLIGWFLCGCTSLKGCVDKFQLNNITVRLVHNLKGRCKVRLGLRLQLGLGDVRVKVGMMVKVRNPL